MLHTSLFFSNIDEGDFTGEYLAEIEQTSLNSNGNLRTKPTTATKEGGGKVKMHRLC